MEVVGWPLFPSLEDGIWVLRQAFTGDLIEMMGLLLGTVEVERAAEYSTHSSRKTLLNADCVSGLSKDTSSDWRITSAAETGPSTHSQGLC